MVDPGPTPRGEKTAQNQDHKRYYANVRPRNAEVSDQFLLHRGAIQGCGAAIMPEGGAVSPPGIAPPVLAGVHIFPSHLSARPDSPCHQPTEHGFVRREEPIPWLVRVHAYLIGQPKEIVLRRFCES